MSHPFAGHRQNKVEHSRVGHITKGYASGGAVHSDEAEDKAMVKKMVKPSAMRMTGGPVKARADKVNRARGGRTKHGGKHTVNVIVAPGGNKPPMPMMPPPGPPPTATAPMPPRQMMPPPPAGIPGGGPPMRARGGKVDQANKAGAAKQRTMVQHAPGKDDSKDIGRKPVVTKANGGALTGSHGERAKGLPGMFDRTATYNKPSRATGGPISSTKAKMAPHAKSGAGGGLSRLDKQHHPDKYEC